MSQGWSRRSIMPTSISKRRGDAALRDALIARALGEGFDPIALTVPEHVPEISQQLNRFIEMGRHGDMGWLADKADWRCHPRALWHDVKSILVVGLNYAPAQNPLTATEDREKAAISVYAQNQDYHDVIKKRLKRIARWLAEEHGAQVKVFVDTAPVAEKPLAQAAGLGWQGKHTNLVSPKHGSWLFLGSIFTDLTFDDHGDDDGGKDGDAHIPARDQCGSCSACLEICPTNAFPAPYQLDARRCISYLTIEHKGHIAEEFRAPMGNRIYGCDDCLAVCPWNKFAHVTDEPAFSPRAELQAPELVALARLDDGEFRTLFSKSPVKRLGRDRFIRNVAIALGNMGNMGNSAAESAVPVLTDLLDDESSLVRAMAVWALFRLAPDRWRELREDRMAREEDPATQDEWARPLR